MTHRLLQSAFFLVIAWGGLMSSAALGDAAFPGARRRFEAVQMAPAILALEPKAGPAGTLLMIKGAKLAGVTRVVFKPDREAPFTVVSDTAVQVTVPDGAQTGPVQVETATGVIKSRDDFTVVPH